MDSTLRERLIELSEKCQILAKSAKYEECIDISQEIISIKKQVYGMEHYEFQKASEKLCEYLNLAAMIHLQREKFQSCLDYLRKAELVARNSIQFKSTTYNNLACYYRRTGKIRTALTYLIQALQLELRLEHPKTLADTHLNLCAVLSQLDRHEDALQHVMLSIILLQDEFLGVLLPEPQDEDTQGQPRVNDERLAVLAIAYHNMGVQFEHLKRYEEAVKIYKKALGISKKYLRDNDQLIQNLTRVVHSATEQIQQRKKSTSDFRRQRVEKEFSESKHNIYKDFAKYGEKIKRLPKLQINKDQFQLQQSYDIDLTRPPARDNRTQSRDRDESVMERASRNFASRKHPRYYKSYAVTPSNESRSIHSQQQHDRSGLGSVPVSEGLKDFNPS